MEQVKKEVNQAEQIEQAPVTVPDKDDYMQKILSLPPEDKAFMDGYLFAKVTELSKKRA